MSLKSYYWGVALVTLLALVFLAGVIYRVNPDTSGMAGKIIFYVSVFFFLSSLYNLILIIIRSRMMDTKESTVANLSISFRQAVLLSLLTIGILFLQSLRMFVWWVGLILVCGALVVELYFLSRNK